MNNYSYLPCAQILNKYDVSTDINEKYVLEQLPEGLEGSLMFHTESSKSEGHSPGMG